MRVAWERLGAANGPCKQLDAQIMRVVAFISDMDRIFVACECFLNRAEVQHGYWPTAAGLNRGPVQPAGAPFNAPDAASRTQCLPLP